ncbi:MAG TPA: hypothetical protein VFU81_12060 [Thermomicrobiales bacterium]|nr:hypothetical protein [Thermomicrobiales bacterium]
MAASRSPEAPSAPLPHEVGAATARRIRLPVFVQNTEAHLNFERFIVSAAASLLAVRIYLEATGFPQVGGGGLHIAHMLWGGLLLVVALLSAITLLGRQVRIVAAVVGGAGFGIFIDEIGKFITSDNNYFFRPAIPLIYAIFVLIYLGYLAALDRLRPSPEAALPQAIDLIEGGVIDGLSHADWIRARNLLLRSNIDHPLTPLLLTALDDIEERRDVRQSAASRLLDALQRRYRWLIRQQWFFLVVLAVATVHTLASVADVAVRAATLEHELSFWSADVIRAAAQLVSAAMIVTGVIRWKASSRLTAYRWFKRGVLVSLLAVQVMSFYVAQIAAVWGLLTDLLLLGSLNFAISQETAGVGRPPNAEPTPLSR